MSSFLKATSHLLDTLDHKIARTEAFLLVLMMIVLTLILVSQVVLRYFFNAPLFWAEEVCVQLLISATFLGISYLIYQGDMIKVDFLLELLPEQASRFIELLLRLVGLATLSLFCVVATQWILQPEIQLDVSPTTGIPNWYNYLLVVISFYLMSWHLLVKTLTMKPHTHSDASLSLSEKG